MNSKILEVAKKFKECKVEDKALKEKVKANNETWTDAENQLIETMIEEGVNSINIDGLGVYTLAKKAFPSVTAANKPGFFVYLRAVGAGELIKEDIPAQTLSAFLKSHIDQLAAKFHKDPIAWQNLLALAGDQKNGIVIPENLRDKTELDEYEAEDAAIAFLKSKGMAFFSQREIRHKEG